jgi:hypothetical protein
LIQYSEDFSDSSWNAVTDVIIDKGYLAPDGSMNATKVTVSGVNPKVALLSGNGSKSIYARTVSGTGTAYFAGKNGVEVISNVTEQWQRFEVNDSPLNNFYAVDFRGASTLTEVIIWGAQREVLPYATSYIPTQGSSSTRIAETCNNSGSAQDFNDSEGVLFVNHKPIINATTHSATTVNNGTANRVYIGNNTTDENLQFFMAVGGSSKINVLTPYPKNAYSKIAFSYKSGNSKGYVNGFQIFSDNVAFSDFTTLNKLSFNNGATEVFKGSVKEVGYYDTILTDEELEYMTSYRSLNELVTELNLNTL